MSREFSLPAIHVTWHFTARDSCHETFHCSWFMSCGISLPAIHVTWLSLPAFHVTWHFTVSDLSHDISLPAIHVTRLSLPAIHVTWLSLPAIHVTWLSLPAIHVTWLSLPSGLACGMRCTLMVKSFIVTRCWMKICCYRSTDKARKAVFWLISFLGWKPSRTIRILLLWMCVSTHNGLEFGNNDSQSGRYFLVYETSLRLFWD